MASHRIAPSVFRVRRTALFGSMLLAAVLATALLSAGEARATLDLGDFAFCENTGSGDGAGSCHVEFDRLSSGFSWHESGPLTEVWFDITFEPSSVILSFRPPAAGKFDQENTNVLLVSGIAPDPDELMFITDVEFTGTWASEPTHAPTTVNSGLPGNNASIVWDLWGANPSNGDIAKINLNFVPEPGTAALLGLGLAGLGVAGRSKRQERKATT